MLNLVDSFYILVLLQDDRQFPKVSRRDDDTFINSQSSASCLGFGVH